MKAIKYDPKIHFEDVCLWAEARSLGLPPKGGLPKTGRIVPGKCALFIYKTDSKVGFMESLISNPCSSPSDIPEAIDLCVQALEKDALDLGIQFIISSSFLPIVADHAKRNGYIVRPESYKLLVKELPLCLS
jgi:hypothetical protein